MINLYKLLFIIAFLFLQGCGGCETAEELGTEERKIDISSTYTYPSGITTPDNTTLWKSSDIFVNSGGIGGTEDITFTVLSNDVNLCPASRDMSISRSNIATYLDTGINVKEGDSIRISLIKKVVTIDCNTSTPGIVIIDREKCLNGYYKQDGSNAFVPPAHQKTVELESYVAIPSDSEKLFAQSNGYKDYIYNAFVSRVILDKIQHQRLISKVLLVPSEYESTTISEGKTIYSYSEFPEIPGNEMDPNTDLGFLTTQLGGSSDPKRIEEVRKKYWCRQYGRNPGPNPNINGNLLLKFCDEFYYLDKDKNKNDLKPDNETLMEYSDWESKPLNQKNMGNTTTENYRVKSILENKSYRKINVGSVDLSGITLPEGVNSSQIQSSVGGDQYIPLLHSRMFLSMDGMIANSQPTSTPNMGNFNSDFTDCSKTSYISRCYGGQQMIPLDYDIPVKRNGKFYFRIGPSHIVDIHPYYGNAEVNIQRTCKLKNLVAYILPMSGSATLNILPTASSTNFIKIPMLNADGSRVEAFTIKGSDIKNDGFIYFAVEDNGDGYQNNKGSIKIRTRVPKNFKDNAFKFFKNLSDMIMDIIFGKKNPVSGLRSGGVADLLFNNIISSERFQSIIRLGAVLTVVIYGICIVIGAIQISTSELIKKVFKLGTVFVLLQPYAWEFFNRFLFRAIIDGARDLAAFTTVPPPNTPGAIEDTASILSSGEKYIFGPLADLSQRLLDFTIWKQVLALIFAGPFGYIFFLFLKMTLLSLLEGTFMVFLTYASSMFIIGILISIAPIFIITLLFQTTSHIFKEWIKVLLSNMLTIVLVFTGINMISGIISSLINQVFGFGVCTSCAVVYDLTDNFPICLMHASLPDGYDATASISDLDGKRFMEKASNTGRFFNIPIPFGGFIALCIMCPLVKTFHEFCTNMASELTGVDFGSPIRSQNVASGIGDSMKWWVGKDAQSKRASQDAGVKKRSDVGGIKIKDK